MSLNQALQGAISGLAAQSRATATVSLNIANALSEGYARRSLLLEPRVVGGTGTGVAVAGVLRAEDPRATAERRAGEAAEGEAARIAEVLGRLAGALGAAGAATGLASRTEAFGTALDRLRDTPESEVLQRSLLEAAGALAGALRQASEAVDLARREADAAAARDVAALGTALGAIVRLNRDIAAGLARGEDVTALEDARQREIDRVNAVVPVRVGRRDGGAVALWTAGGAVLLDGRAVAVDFTATPVITRDMTLGTGALSPVRLDGAEAAPGRFEGGTLGAALHIRDTLAPELGAALDAFAAEILARLEAVDTDAGGAGLLTDAGAPFDPGTEPGLAGRLAVNAAVDPAQGGALWRLRDGLGAAVPGEVADATLLAALAGAWSARVPAPAATGLSGQEDVSGLAAGIAALAAAAAARAEQTEAGRAARAATLREAETAATGVDTNAELARLLAIERAWAANARVIATVDALFRELLEI